MPAADVSGKDYEARHITHLTGRIQGSSPRRSAGCCRRAPSSWPTRAPTWRGSATTWTSRRARTSARPARSGRWPGTSTARSG
ncbi:hypothetical protein ACFQ0B_72700 [Nonomuraea thailandensis]